MKIHFHCFIGLLAAASLPAWADKSAVARAGEPVSRNVRNVRDAVRQHNAAERQRASREDAAAGRRLTADERAELREQLRAQWQAHVDTPHSAQWRPDGALLPVTAPVDRPAGALIQPAPGDGR